ncbi:MAG: HD domain-containing protein [Clostridia bacterium]|nr:HD domain-containing protein [Clostridia bacterium]NLS86293.1 HD domain-containing protein [Oscillospiraceae bacterium]
MVRLSKTVVSDISVPNDREYLLLVKNMLDCPQVAQMSQYIQHGTTTCLGHSINVSYLSYLYCRKHGLNSCAAARGGLLHDLFLYDWHLKKREKGELLHGFNHPRVALENAKKLFELSPLECDIILRHMWPLTITPPRYKETFIIVWFDKYCSTMETIRQPVMTLFDTQESIINTRLRVREEIKDVVDSIKI